MKRKSGCFYKKHGIAKRIFSILLAFAMVLTLNIPNGIASVKADDGVKLYFELPSGTSVSDWCVNAWGTSVTVTGNSDNAFRPTSWGETGDPYPTLLSDESLSGWGYVTVSGTISGLQFVKTDGTEYNCWNTQISEQGYTTAYYSPDSKLWYADSNKETEIKAKSITLYFELPESTSVTDWCVNVWGTSIAVTGDSGNAFRPTTWGDGDTLPTLLSDESLSGWGYVTVSGTIEGLQFVKADGTEYNCWNTLLADSGYEVFYYSPSDYTWYADSDKTIPAISTDVVSPEVDGTSVTFRYKSSSAESVLVTGGMTGWVTSSGDGAYAMTKGDDDVWSVTVTLSPGTYSYKYIVDGSNWLTDPYNNSYDGDSNSQVFVPGLADGTVEVVKGEETQLPTTLKLYDTDGGSQDVAVTYTLATTAAASYVTIDGTKITVSSDYTGDSLELTAQDGSGNTSTVTVSLVDTLYTYTIYYYDWTEAHRATNASALWIWQNGGGDGIEYYFTETKDIDGYTWLKATVQLSYYEGINVIPRSYGSWDWQAATKEFDNSGKDAEMTVYLVGDNTTVYTTPPDLSSLVPRDRYVVVEYVPASTYNDWNIFTWNNGITERTEIYAEQTESGKYYMTVPVADYDVDFQLGFCMRQCSEKDADDWKAKDGGDHYVTVPADQTVVKVVFVEGEGITETLPYNTGYEMDGDNGCIHFYYRDDSLFLTDTLSSLSSVAVEINGTQYAMQYDSVNERYYYDYTNLSSGDYRYRYVVDGEYVLDSFNENTTTVDETEYSVVTYKEFDDLTITATLLNATMDYNDNNVLYVDFSGSDASKITTEEIRSITAKLSALGVDDLEIEPELMAGTISCLYSTTLGTKQIPVTLTDIYGHTYTTSASVQVTERDKSDGDFDWDEAIIYFTVTDRFFDGDTSNNDGVDTDGSLSYHGGDFEGLNQKLDYLQELGVNTIWITPIVENSDTTTEKDNETIESTGYHGYWASDFTELNSHLGTEEQFAALIEAAHERGMKIMVDVVINHAGYGTEDYFNTILVDEDGEYISMIRDSSNTVSGSDIYDSLSGLPDFVTEDAAVREQLIEWQTDWMDKYDIDYYRVDTVKHVDSTTWAAFKNALTEINPEFKMTGEYSGAGYASATGELGTGSMDALLDFDFNGWAADFLTGSIESVESSLVSRNSAINNTATTSQFLNSHDEDGLQYTLQSEKGLSEDEAYALMKVAASLTITAKGQPVIYYGEEIGLYGEDNYPYQTNRYDFDWDELEDQMADSASIYNHYKTMLEIRNSYSELFARGDRVTIKTSNDDGYDVFSRSYDGTTLYIGMNIASGAQTVSFAVEGDEGTVYIDLYSGEKYTVSASGTVSVSIPAAADGGTVVLKETETTSEILTEATSNDGYTVAAGATAETLKEIVYSAATERELIQLQAGADAVLYMTVSDISSTVSAAEKKLVKSVAGGYTVGAYLDLDCFIEYGIITSQKYELSSAIQVSLTLPESLINTDSSKTRVYKVVRIHDGEATLLDAKYDSSTGKLTFETDRFSTYAIVYYDTENTSGSTTTKTTSTASTSTTSTTPMASTSTTSTTVAVETGDTVPYAGYVLIVLFGGALIAFSVRRRRDFIR